MKKALALLVFLCMTVCFAREYITAEKSYVERIKIGDKYIMLCEFAFTKDLSSKEVSCDIVLSVYEGVKLVNKINSLSRSDLTEAAAFLKQMSAISESGNFKESGCVVKSQTASEKISAYMFYSDKELLFYIGSSSSRIQIKEIRYVKEFCVAFESAVDLYDKHFKEFSAISL